MIINQKKNLVNLFWMRYKKIEIKKCRAGGSCRLLTVVQ